MIITYRIKYQTRRRSEVSIPQGDWLDKERVVLAREDAREAINEVISTINNSDFRLRGVEIVGRVDMIACNLQIGDE